MTALHQAAQKAVARIRHTLMTGLAHNDAIAALNELAALQQQPEPVALSDELINGHLALAYAGSGLNGGMCGVQWDHIVARRFFGIGAGVALGMIPAPPALQEVPREPVTWPEIILMVRAWFEGDPDAALAELEHRAKAAAPSTTQQQEATSLTELYNALADWCRESDGITVGLPSELVVALMARLAPK